jgi:hypothetical protein
MTNEKRKSSGEGHAPSLAPACASRPGRAHHELRSIVRDRQIPQFSAASILEGSRIVCVATDNGLKDSEIIFSPGTLGAPVTPNESKLLRAGRVDSAPRMEKTGRRVSTWL